MDLDVGQIRFFTKVAEKAPRGLRLLLFKEKATNSEKLVFIVKTASDEVEKLALSKMTWVIEQSKTAPRVVIVRLMILLEANNEFYKSETGLLMNEPKDRSTLMALAKQRSVEIYFFTHEPEFHSKIELLTTPNMANSAMKAFDANPMIDDSRALNKSETLSEFDIKNAIKDKSKVHLDSTDLSDSIQKKMPTMSSTGTIKTKSEEAGKVSIKSNDVMSQQVTFQSSNINKPNPIVKPEPFFKQSVNPQNFEKKATPDVSKQNNDVYKKSTESKSNITMEDLMKTIPPEAKQSFNFEQKPATNSPSGLTLNDLKNAISMPPNKISADELMNTIPPQAKQTFNFEQKPVTNSPSGLTLNDLKNAISMPPNKITANELMNTIPPEKAINKKADSSPLDSFDFFNSFQSSEDKEQGKKDFENAMSNTKSSNMVETDDLFSILSLAKEEKKNIEPEHKNVEHHDASATLFSPYVKEEAVIEKKPELKNTPIHVSTTNPINTVSNNIDENPFVKTQDLLSILKTEGGLSDSILNMYNKKDESVVEKKEESLLSELMSEPSPIPKEEVVPKSSSYDSIKLNTVPIKNFVSVKKDELLSSLKSEPSPIPKEEVIPKSNSYDSIRLNTVPIKNFAPIKKDELLSSLKSEPSPLRNDSLLTELMSETSPLKTVGGDTTNLAKEIEKNIVNRHAQIKAIEKKQDISTDDLLRALQDD